jgi:hypothetical protein
MKLHSSGADQQNLDGQQGQPTDECGRVIVDHRRKQTVDLDTVNDLRHESHQDSEPEQRHHQQKEVAIPPPMIGKSR